MSGKKTFLAALLCAVGLGALGLSLSRRGAGAGGTLGTDFSHQCGLRLGALVARHVPEGGCVVVVSGELKGTNSPQRRSELDGLREALRRGGVKIAAVLRPAPGTQDLDERSGGASLELLQKALREAPDAAAVVTLAGLPGGPPPGGAPPGNALLFAYEQTPRVAARWQEAGACRGLILRGGSELVEWEGPDRHR